MFVVLWLLVLAVHCASALEEGPSLSVSPRVRTHHDEPGGGRAIMRASGHLSQSPIDERFGQSQLDLLEEVSQIMGGIGLEELEVLGVQPTVELTGLAHARRKVVRSFRHHLSAAEGHIVYVEQIAKRTGMRLWSGHGVVADLLLRFRLTAFTSEVGESLRPLIFLWQVRATYAVSWLYVFLDVVLRAGDEASLRGWYVSTNGRTRARCHTLLPAHGCSLLVRAFAVCCPLYLAVLPCCLHLRTWRVVRTLLFFSIFHSIATMALPALIIHTAVHQSQRALRMVPGDAPWLTHLRQWGPTIVGLALIPLMPIFDEPMEALLERVFHRVWPLPPNTHLATRTDYEVAIEAEEEAAANRLPPGKGESALRPPVPPPRESREEPELRRATGQGEPVYTDRAQAPSSVACSPPPPRGPQVGP